MGDALGPVDPSWLAPLAMPMWVSVTVEPRPDPSLIPRPFKQKMGFAYTCIATTAQAAVWEMETSGLYNDAGDTVITLRVDWLEQTSF